MQTMSAETRTNDMNKLTRDDKKYKEQDRRIQDKTVNDLYAGLNTSLDVLQHRELQMKHDELLKKCNDYEQKLGELSEDNKKLGDRNTILERNISAVFHTAQKEIKRKDNEIQRLREQIEHYDQSMK